MTTSDIELDAFLGDFRADLDDDTYQTLRRTVAAIQTRYPDDDLRDDRTLASSTAAQLAFGDTTLGQVAAEYATARTAERDAMAALVGAIIWADTTGASQRSITETAGVTRTTVRRALGL